MRNALIVGGVLIAGAVVTALGKPDSEPNYTNAGELWWDVVRDADGLGLQLSRVSAAEEMDAGRKMALRIVSGSTVATAWQTYVEAVGQGVAKQVGRKDIRYEFHVIDEPTVNAFALPGGQIFIFTGLLEKMQNEAELASVLGHEVGHVDARHCIERLQYELRMKRLGLKELGQITDLLRRLPEQGYAQYQELEADELGVRMSLAAGYDPGDGIALFRRLFVTGTQMKPTSPLEELASVALSTVFDYFRSHPPTPERMRRMQGLVDTERRKSTGRLVYRGTENFNRRIPMSQQQFGGETVRL